MIRWLALTVAAGGLAGCAAPPPTPANPALWEVTAPGGVQAYLFGTIHALPALVAWRTPKVAAALADSRELVVEIGGLNDAAAMHAAFARRAAATKLPPLAARLSPPEASRLADLQRRLNIAPDALDHEKDWAAAMTIGAAAIPYGYADNGVDRALLTHTQLPVRELEGADVQFASFDGLPPAAQRRMLGEIIDTAPSADADTRRLAVAWARGDMAVIASESDTGLLADPALRAALYVARNRIWARRIAAEIRAKHRPFVAVGAAHMVGPEGLVALLAAQGFTVRRIE